MTSNRRTPRDLGEDGAALTRQSNPSAGPTDVEALNALGILRRWLAGAPTAREFHQDDLPPGVSRDSFLRRHRLRMQDGAPGWTKCGKSRIVSAAAWAEDVAKETSLAALRRSPLRVVRASPTVDELDAELDRALGIRVRSSQ
jgi:hypothetical protein